MWPVILAMSAQDASTVVLRVGYRPGSRTWRGRGVDTLWRTVRAANPSVRVVYYWIGSDVYRTLKDAGAGHTTGALAEAAKHDCHIAGAPWLVEELETVGIQARYIPHPARLPTVDPAPSLPIRFSVLAYIPAGRFDFYGGRELLEAASCMPTVTFRVMGSAAPSGAVSPPNVVWLGWRPDAIDPLVASSVYVRPILHDGLSITVREALSLGRHVVYTYPIPHVHLVPYGDAPKLVDALQQLQADSESDHLPLNAPGRRWVIDEFDPGRNSRTLAAALVEAGETRPGS